jgi:hypothetical protein
MISYLVLETDADKKEEPEGCTRLIFSTAPKKRFSSGRNLTVSVRRTH